jgi:hypothetical protein
MSFQISIQNLNKLSTTVKKKLKEIMEELKIYKKHLKRICG